MALSLREQDALLSPSRARTYSTMSSNDDVRSNSSAAAADLPLQVANDPDTKTTEISDNVERYVRLFGADEDSFSQPTTIRKELWSYYLYYNGDNGVGPGSYSQTL